MTVTVAVAVCGAWSVVVVVVDEPGETVTVSVTVVPDEEELEAIPLHRLQPSIAHRSRMLLTHRLWLCASYRTYRFPKFDERAADALEDLLSELRAQNGISPARAEVAAVSSISSFSHAPT